MVALRWDLLEVVYAVRMNHVLGHVEEHVAQIHQVALVLEVLSLYQHCRRRKLSCTVNSNKTSFVSLENPKKVTISTFFPSRESAIIGFTVL
ncbi:hypothetical protein LWI28_010154 [Acer negundo]|uniref:Uncharacterized protein n=1 Tax=Acer negundo TaxID=4023 RepID=A0AAD5JAH6_ACENE|nr:hypothetical protein LWI28_010154 [Acer negundo]